MATLNLYVTVDEKIKLKDLAKKRGVSISDLLTEILKEEENGKTDMGVTNVQEIP